MRKPLELSFDAQAYSQFLGQGSHQKNTNWAYADAIRLALATTAVDDRAKGTGLLLAIGGLRQRAHFGVGVVYV